MNALNTRYRSYGKRIFDCTTAAFLIVLFLPLLLTLCLILFLANGQPLLFLQERTGKHGRTFRLYKFRTMNFNRDSKGDLLPDKERITRFGNLMRRTSLDELPELWNILIGDMSLVGPRPLPTRYLNRYDEFQARRHLERPGLTGLAQILGRNDTTWAERLRHDEEYVETYTFWLDVQIIFKTVSVVLNQTGATTPNSATMPEFLGTEVKLVEDKP